MPNEMKETESLQTFRAKKKEWIDFRLHAKRTCRLRPVGFT